jgi:hypothetical protein
MYRLSGNLVMRDARTSFPYRPDSLQYLKTAALRNGVGTRRSVAQT